MQPSRKLRRTPPDVPDGLATSTATDSDAGLLKELSKKLGGFGLEIASIAKATNVVSQVVKDDVERFCGLTAKLEQLEALKSDVQNEVSSAGSVSKQANSEIEQSCATVKQALDAMNLLI